MKMRIVTGGGSGLGLAIAEKDMLVWIFTALLKRIS
jgi:hypothetical protein